MEIEKIWKDHAEKEIIMFTENYTLGMNSLTKTTFERNLRRHFMTNAQRRHLVSSPDNGFNID